MLLRSSAEARRPPTASSASRWPGCAAGWPASASRPATASASSPPTTGTSSSPTSSILGAGCGRGAAQPVEPGGRARARARHHRGAGRVRRPDRQARRSWSSIAAKVPIARARHHESGRRGAGRRAPRRPDDGTGGRRRRPGAGRPRRVDVHQRAPPGSPKAAMLSHGNLLSNIEQLQAFRGPGPTPRRRGVRRAAAVPHLRPQRRARAPRCRPDRPSCSSSGSTRSPRSTRSVDHGVTIVSGAPTMWGAWASLPSAPTRALRHRAHGCLGRIEAPRRDRRAGRASASASTCARGTA